MREWKRKMYERRRLLPKEADINVYDSLDERVAVRHFLGKDLVEAEALFRENFLTYQEDLMWMGPKAFAFYVRAAIAFLASPNSSVDIGDASAFCSVIESRLEPEPEVIAPVAQVIRECIVKLLEDLERDAWEESVYRDTPEELRALLVRLG